MKNLEFLLKYYKSLIDCKKDYVKQGGEYKEEKLIEIGILRSVIKDLKKYVK